MSSSPPRKKQRMSSPIYEDMTCSDFEALDELEARISQDTSDASSQSQSQEGRSKRSRAIADAPAEPSGSGLHAVENSNLAHTSSAHARVGNASQHSSTLFVPRMNAGLQSALSLHTDGRHGSPRSIHEDKDQNSNDVYTAGGRLSPSDNSRYCDSTQIGMDSASATLYSRDVCKQPLTSSPEAQPEPDYDTWFQSHHIPTTVGFQSARSLSDSKPTSSPETSNFIGFKSAKFIDTSLSLSQSTPIPACNFQSAQSLLPSMSTSNDDPSSFIGFRSAKFVEPSFSSNAAGPLAESGVQGSESIMPSTPAFNDDPLSFDGFKSAKFAEPSFSSNAPQLFSKSDFQSAQSILPPMSTSIDEPSFVGFTSAKFVEPSFSSNAAGPSYETSFQSAKHIDASLSTSIQAPTSHSSAAEKDKFAISSTALRRAAERMRRWEEEESRLAPVELSTANVETPPRAVLKILENSSQTPDTPSPGAGFVKSAATAGGLKGKNKLFKSPLLVQPPPRPMYPSSSSTVYVNSPLNPTRLSGRPSTSGVRSTSQSSIVSAPVMAAPSPTGDISYSTPRKPVRVAPLQGSGTGAPKKKFVTPFKPGMRPGEPGRVRLEQDKENKKSTALDEHPSTSKKRTLQTERQNGKLKCKWFDLSIVPNRQSLVSSGLVPQSYSKSDLESMGINVDELTLITPASAMYYSFNTTSSAPPDPSTLPVDNISLGPTEALKHLLNKGCAMATQEWVKNHWGFILWKLAGMACLDPESENNPKTRKWCWSQVIDQLLYRYERELDGGLRPPLRLIATRDAPASCPLILCVSGIKWSGPPDKTDGQTGPVPELEVTDGWYNLRAEVDACLARAIRKGIIRIGRKLAIQGARLSSDRREPTEVLEAYSKCRLVLSGNSCHLAPWHAKLGFQGSPYLAALGSLSADGGAVAIMDLVVVQVHPIAFIEFIEGDDGKQRREGPHNEKDEARAHDLWEKRREIEVSKWRENLEKEIRVLEGYLSRLEQKAGSRWRVPEDGLPPPSIDCYFEELQDTGDIASMVRRLSEAERGWLGQLIHQECNNLREKAHDEMEQHLKTICPPRNVRNFRVIVAEDARTCRKPSHRRAQVTVWDVLGLTFGEGAKAGAFAENQRFLVTNLVPSQRSAWMANAPGSEVYLNTRRDSRWTKIA